MDGVKEGRSEGRKEGMHGRNEWKEWKKGGNVNGIE
jgi:hypothetical protein